MPRPAPARIAARIAAPAAVLVALAAAALTATALTATAQPAPTEPVLPVCEIVRPAAGSGNHLVVQADNPTLVNQTCTVRCITLDMTTPWPPTGDPDRGRCRFTIPAGTAMTTVCSFGRALGDSRPAVMTDFYCQAS